MSEVDDEQLKSTQFDVQHTGSFNISLLTSTNKPPPSPMLMGQQIGDAKLSANIGETTGQFENWKPPRLVIRRYLAEKIHRCLSFNVSG